MKTVEKVANCITDLRGNTCTQKCRDCEYNVSEKTFDDTHLEALEFIENSGENMINETVTTMYDIMIACPVKVEAPTSQRIMEACEGIAAMLSEKNEKYGDSALNPLKIFSKEDSDNSLLSRLDDKLARIQNSDELSRDDVMDITGYLVLLMLAKGWEGYEGNVEKL